MAEGNKKAGSDGSGSFAEFQRVALDINAQPSYTGKTEILTRFFKEFRYEISYPTSINEEMGVSNTLPVVTCISSASSCFVAMTRESTISEISRS